MAGFSCPSVDEVNARAVLSTRPDLGASEAAQLNHSEASAMTPFPQRDQEMRDRLVRYGLEEDAALLQPTEFSRRDSAVATHNDFRSRQSVDSRAMSLSQVAIPLSVRSRRSTSNSVTLSLAPTKQPSSPGRYYDEPALQFSDVDSTHDGSDILLE